MFFWMVAADPDAKDVCFVPCYKNKGWTALSVLVVFAVCAEVFVTTCLEFVYPATM